jgi:hypothetical protein
VAVRYANELAAREAEFRQKAKYGKWSEPGSLCWTQPLLRFVFLCLPANRVGSISLGDAIEIIGGTGNENMTTWRDQVALVTGGARGIGRATAQRVAAVCVNCAAHADAAEGLAAEIMAAGGRAIAAMANVAEAATVEMMVARAEKELGPATILARWTAMLRDWSMPPEQ